LFDNISIAENTSTNLFINISGGYSPYAVIYTRNEITQTTISNYTSGQYISTGVLKIGVYIYALVSVTDTNGCQAQIIGSDIDVTVTGELKNIPDVFTPNGDGINETWIIPSIQNYPDAVIRIYDRNLKLIILFHGSDPNWDGRDSHGNPMPIGAYLYGIDLKNGTKPIKGYISIVR